MKQPSLVSTGPQNFLDTIIGSPAKTPTKLNTLKLISMEIVEEETRPASTRDPIQADLQAVTIERASLSREFLGLQPVQIHPRKTSLLTKDRH